MAGVQQTLLKLRQLAQQPPKSDGIKDQAIHAYINKVYQDFESMIDSVVDENEIYDYLEDQFLPQNWLFVQGTALGYTAIPNEEITIIICELANTLAEARNQDLDYDDIPIVPIELLMPGLQLESGSDKYFDFSATKRATALSAKEQDEKEQLIKSIQSAKYENGDPIPESIEAIIFSDELEADETFSEHQKYMDYENLLSRRNSPAGAMGHLNDEQFNKRVKALDISEDTLRKIRQIQNIKKLEQLKSKDENYANQQRQIERDQLKHFNEKYLVRAESLTELLNTHITSETGHALKPVAALLDETSRALSYIYPDEEHIREQLEKVEGILSDIDNFLLTDDDSISEQVEEEGIEIEINDQSSITEQLKQKQQALLQKLRIISSKNEYRLSGHSQLTINYKEAKEALTRVESEKVSLLGYIRELCDELSKNDVNSGHGSEYHAGGDAYDPIRKFAEYYDGLGYQIETALPIPQKKLEGKIYLDIKYDESSKDFEITYHILSKEGTLIQASISAQELPSLSKRLNEIRARSNKNISEGKNAIEITPALIAEEIKDFQREIIIITQQRGHTKQQDEEKHKIPELLRQQLEKLIELSRNVAANSSGGETAAVDTCLALRRHSIETVLHGHEVEVSSIGNSSESQVRRVAECREKYVQARQALESAVQNKTYHGVDRSSLTHQQLSSLGIQPIIRSLEDFNIVLDFDEQQLANIDIKLSEDFKMSKGELSNLARDLPVNKLSVFLKYLNKDASNNLLSILPSLNRLAEDKLTVICDHLFKQGLLPPSKLLLYNISGLEEFKKIALSDLKVARQEVMNDPSLFQYAPESLKEDKQFALELMTQSGLAIAHLSKNLQEDPDIVQSAITKDPEAYKLLNNDYKHDEDIAMSCLSRNGEMIEFAPSAIKQNIQFQLAAIANTPKALNYIDINSPNYHVLQKIASVGLLRQRKALCTIYQNDHDKAAIIEALKINGLGLELVSNLLKHDIEVIATAIENNPKALAFCPDDVLQSEHFMIHLMKKNGMALILLPAGLKANEQVVIAAVSQKGAALQYAAAELKANEQVVAAAVCQHGGALQYADPKLKANKSIALTAIQNNALAYKFVSQDLKKDPEVFLAAMKTNPNIFEFADQSIQEDSRFQQLCFLEPADRVSACESLLDNISHQQKIQSRVENLTPEHQRIFSMMMKMEKMNPQNIGSCLADPEKLPIIERLLDKLTQPEQGKIISHSAPVASR